MIRALRLIGSLLLASIAGGPLLFIAPGYWLESGILIVAILALFHLWYSLKQNLKTDRPVAIDGHWGGFGGGIGGWHPSHEALQFGTVLLLLQAIFFVLIWPGTNETRAVERALKKQLAMLEKTADDPSSAQKKTATTELKKIVNTAATKATASIVHAEPLQRLVLAVEKLATPPQPASTASILRQVLDVTHNICIEAVGEARNCNSSQPAATCVEPCASNADGKSSPQPVSGINLEGRARDTVHPPFSHTSETADRTEKLLDAIAENVRAIHRSIKESTSAVASMQAQLRGIVETMLKNNGGMNIEALQLVQVISDAYAPGASHRGAGDQSQSRQHPNLRVASVGFNHNDTSLSPAGKQLVRQAIANLRNAAGPPRRIVLVTYSDQTPPDDSGLDRTDREKERLTCAVAEDFAYRRAKNLKDFIATEFNKVFPNEKKPEIIPLPLGVYLQRFDAEFAKREPYNRFGDIVFLYDADGLIALEDKASRKLCQERQEKETAEGLAK